MSSSRSGSCKSQAFEEQGGHNAREMCAGIIGGDDGAQHIAQITCDGDFVDGMGDFAVFDPEARCASGIVACVRVDCGADQRGDEEACAHVAQKLGVCLRALGESNVPDAWRGRAACASCGVGCAFHPELTRVGEVKCPALKHAVADDVARGCGQTLGVKRARRRGAGAVWVFYD